MRALKIKLFRDLSHMKGQAVAIGAKLDRGETSVFSQLLNGNRVVKTLTGNSVAICSRQSERAPTVAAL